MQQETRMISCKLENRWTGGILAGAGNRILNLEWKKLRTNPTAVHGPQKARDWQQQGLLELEAEVGVNSKLRKHDESCCGSE